LLGTSFLLPLPAPASRAPWFNPMIAFCSAIHAGAVSSPAFEVFQGAAADTFSYVADDRRVVLGNGKAGSAVLEGAGARLNVFRARAVPWWFAKTLVIGVGDRTITG
jgi:hypothetical protein